MRNLDGLEMLCFCRAEHFELRYEGGQYLDPRGNVVEDILDMGCFACSAAYYTRSGDAVGYCPNCGLIERKRFTQREDLLEYLLGNDLSWTAKNRLTPVTIETFEGEWKLLFTRDPGQLEASGRYKNVRKM